MLIDAHCHLYALSRVTQEAVLSSLGRERILVESSIDLTSSKVASRLSGLCNFLFTSLGFHPFSAEAFKPALTDTYEALIRSNPKVVAIGEIGLDYKAPASDELQEKVCAAFLDLARRTQKAVVIHLRSDTDERLGRMLELIDSVFPSYDKVVFHCFSQAPEFLERVVRKGASVSFSLNILRNSETIQASLAQCPLGRLLLETDSPYMKIKDASSTPLDIAKVYDRAAAVKGIARGDLERVVSENVMRIFGIS